MLDVTDNFAPWLCNNMAAVFDVSLNFMTI